MIKIVQYITFLLLLLLGGTLTGCRDLTDECADSSMGSAVGKMQIKGIVPGMDPWAVTTRADNKDDAEKKIHSLQLFIFDNNGEPLLLKIKEEGVSEEQWYQSDAKGSFVIDKGLFADQPKTQSKICLIANAEDLSNKIHNYAQLKQHTIEFTDGTNIAEKGLPMFGEIMSDLTSTNSQGEVININLRALVARVDFELSIANVTTDGPYDPSFKLLEYELHNLPRQITVEESDHKSPIKGDYSKKISSPTQLSIAPGSAPIKFHFYMGEHLRTAIPFTYPPKIEENAKQRFKPMLAEKDAAYVLLRGTFVDHQSVSHLVTYKIYLGANHTNNFEVFRNKQYKNNITFKSITNRDENTEGISVDHRVNVTNDKFLVTIERETKLDSHIEIRPLDIVLADGGRVEAKILDSTSTPWFRMEKGSNKGVAYCSSDGPHKGKRLYFTTDLVTKTLEGQTSVTVSDNSDNRIWLYFDENLYASKGKTRTAQLELSFFDNANDRTPSKQEIYTFIQRDLYPVTYNGKTYFIEYYEEYLYNFDPKDGFGDTTDGMKWGLENKEISDQIRSITLPTDNWMSEYIQDLIDKVSPYYDFEKPNTGVIYTEKIIKKTNRLNTSLETKIDNAVEYCYNKNKRKSNGEVQSLNWYMPAIQEIEEICMGAYTSFDVFQDKYYWSSQPAYETNQYKCSYWLSSNPIRGDYRKDNVLNARATKVNDNFETIGSGASGTYKETSIRWTLLGGAGTPSHKYINKMINEEGNMKRETINRVRAVRVKTNDIIIRD